MPISWLRTANNNTCREHPSDARFFFTVTVLLNFFHFFPTFFLYIFAIMDSPRRTVGFPFSTQSNSQISTFTLLYFVRGFERYKQDSSKRQRFPRCLFSFPKFLVLNRHIFPTFVALRRAIINVQFEMVFLLFLTSWTAPQIANYQVMLFLPFFFTWPDRKQQRALAAVFLWSSSFPQQSPTTSSQIRHSFLTTPAPHCAILCSSVDVGFLPF